MRTRWYVFVITGLSVLLGISFTRNYFAYRQKSIWWKASKSIIEVVLIVLLGEWLPAILAGWAIVWVGRPIKNPMYKVVVCSVFGLLLSGILLEFGFEFVLLMSIFSIDLVTGTNGFLGRLKQAESGDIR